MYFMCLWKTLTASWVFDVRANFVLKSIKNDRIDVCQQYLNFQGKAGNQPNIKDLRTFNISYLQIQTDTNAIEVNINIIWYILIVN
uniref:Uncharacterized protein n=1 Tax=Kuenenia stuttgartiensis TaxID=174633 RepID=Q1Q2W7_KUEST|nr:unknown protein [Candidatus Kuenenia stuttgartiensis]